MTDVEGGLDEPVELQPPPGALALASADDDATRADWEKAAAGVLRKARRLGDDAPDSSVWEWGPNDAQQRVTGAAEDFCMLVTQRRPQADLDVHPVGADAEQWLGIAQAFAGPPGPGRD